MHLRHAFLAVVAPHALLIPVSADVATSPFSHVELFFRTNDATYWAIARIGKHISWCDYQAQKSIVASIHLS